MIGKIIKYGMYDAIRDEFVLSFGMILSFENPWNRKNILLVLDQNGQHAYVPYETLYNIDFV